jgi:hypothetical protein
MGTAECRLEMPDRMKKGAFSDVSMQNPGGSGEVNLRAVDA